MIASARTVAVDSVLATVTEVGQDVIACASIWSRDHLLFNRCAFDINETLTAPCVAEAASVSCGVVFPLLVYWGPVDAILSSNSVIYILG